MILGTFIGIGIGILHLRGIPPKITITYEGPEEYLGVVKNLEDELWIYENWWERGEPNCMKFANFTGNLEALSNLRMDFDFDNSWYFSFEVEYQKYNFETLEIALYDMIGYNEWDHDGLNYSNSYSLLNQADISEYLSLFEISEIGYDIIIENATEEIPSMDGKNDLITSYIDSLDKHSEYLLIHQEFDQGIQVAPLAGGGFSAERVFVCTLSGEILFCFDDLLLSTWIS